MTVESYGAMVGAIGFGPINGPARRPVLIGQAMLGEGFSIGRLKIEHVFIVVPGGQVVEAMPGGARLAPLDGSRFTPEYAYCLPAEDYPGQAEDAAAIALAMLGTPYSYGSYAMLAAWHYGLHADWLAERIDRREPPEALAGMHKASPGMALGTLSVALPKEAICSVLVDQAWSLTGKKLLTDTKPQIVTPGRLAENLLERQQAPGQWLWCGAS